MPNSAKKDEAEQKWQKKLLPLMVRMIVGLTLFFFIATCIQLIYLQLSILNSPQIAMDEYLSLLSLSPQASAEEIISTAKLKAILMLEANSLEQHHHQVHVFLMSRVWMRYLGFVTGMILSLVGATFILGKLHTLQSEVSTKLELVEFSFKSASPGLILTILGVVLMISAIVTHHQIEWTTAPVYINGIESSITIPGLE